MMSTTFSQQLNPPQTPLHEMGNSESKTTPEPSHVWKSETPVRFSQGLVDSLTESTETDSSRAKTLELQIQARVAAELRKLAEQEDSLYRTITEKLSAPDSESTPPKSAGDALRELSRESVQADVQDLKEKLEKRKKVRALEELDGDGALKEAREKVVKCLRGNDRRALDCWEEVGRFKREVARVEGEWVQRVFR